MPSTNTSVGERELDVESIRETYALLAATLAFSVFTAFLGAAFRMSYVGCAVSFVISMVLLFVVFLTKDSRLGLPALFAFVGWDGLTFGPCLRQLVSAEWGPSLVLLSAGITAAIFIVISGMAFLLNRDFGHLGNLLTAALMILLILGVARWETRLPGACLIWSGCCSLVFSGFVLYDTDRLIREEEYDPIGNTLNLYLDVWGLFASVLPITHWVRRDED